FLMAVVPLEQHDGLPLAFFEAPVDALGLGIDFGQQIAVTLDVRAAGSAHLNEAELRAEPGEFFEEALDASKALQDSLGIVHPVDADSDVGGLHADLF